jgi:hypothetical protein
VIPSPSVARGNGNEPDHPVVYPKGLPSVSWPAIGFAATLFAADGLDIARLQRSTEPNGGGDEHSAIGISRFAVWQVRCV